MRVEHVRIYLVDGTEIDDEYFATLENDTLLVARDSSKSGETITYV